MSNILILKGLPPVLLQHIVLLLQVLVRYIYKVGDASYIDFAFILYFQTRKTMRQEKTRKIEIWSSCLSYGYIMAIVMHLFNHSYAWTHSYTRVCAKVFWPETNNLRKLNIGISRQIINHAMYIKILKWAFINVINLRRREPYFLKTGISYNKT